MDLDRFIYKRNNNGPEYTNKQHFVTKINFLNNFV